MSCTEAMTFMPLSGGRGEGKFTLVDHEDYERLRGKPWHLGGNGYITQSGSPLLHREVLGLTPGDQKMADHINHDKLDNRRGNLRALSNAENSQNRCRFAGVTFRPGQTQRPWSADVRLHLGSFASEEEAAETVREFRRNHMPYSQEANEEES